MDASIQTALVLLIVGMTTVFFVLGIIVLLSRLLIRLTNHLYSLKHSPLVVIKSDASISTIKKEHLAVITAAVDGFSKGTATIRHIERKTPLPVN